MFVYIFRERVLPALVRYFWPLLVIYACWVHGNSCFLHMKLGLYVDTVQGGLVSLLILAAAYKFGKHSLRHDYSYSIYLYHEIFVNILLIAGFIASWWAIGTVYLLTAVAAVLTCRLVEEPVSRILKDRIR